MQLKTKLAGSVAIFAAFFFGTFYLMDLFDPGHVANQTRVSDVRILKDAIERYHRDHGSYPALAGNPVDDLAKDLVQGGYLKQIPSDPLRDAGVFQYQYASDGRAAYGILVRQSEEKFARNMPEMLCVVGVGTKQLPSWSNLPGCWF